MVAFDPDAGRGGSAYGREEQRMPVAVEGAGGGMGDLADRFGQMGVKDAPNENLIQVMRAMEAAEKSIRQQLEENNHLKSELMKKTKELERYRIESTSAKISSEVSIGERDMNRWLGDGSLINPHDMLAIHQEIAGKEESSFETGKINQHYYENNNADESLRKVPGAQSGHNKIDPSQFSAPSSRSLSPNKHRKEIEYDMGFNLSGSGLMPLTESNTDLRKRELMFKVREHEEEIAQLRKHLADYSVKEAQIRNEKYVLEKRIAYMRMAFDQQQQDLVDAAAKAISYRQEIIEENIRLTYALQAAQAERSTFVSSLLPLLSEHQLDPAAHDAQSIVRNLKVLFRHMQEKLIIAEDKIRESQYQLAPWHAETSNNVVFPSQSPSHNPIMQKNNLEIVPQTTFQHIQSPMSSPANVGTRYDSGLIGNLSQQADASGIDTRNLGHDNLDKTSSVSRNTALQDASTHRIQSDSQGSNITVEPESQRLSFKDLVVSKTEDSETTVAQYRSSVPTSQDDPNSYPLLPPVLEEPSSSFSEAADDDPLPAIEGLQISGEAYPGRELQASGYSINGTTSCNFEWVRYLEDGSMKHIVEARQPLYLVTADDVDSYLAIQVQPLDDRGRKGDPVKVFANDQRKITCDPDTQEQIRRTVTDGNASYEVLLSAKYLDIWHPAILAIKREGYSIKCNGPRGVVVAEKFKPSINILIPYGRPSEFVIQDDTDEFVLKAAENGLPRDIIVLTMRYFIRTARQRRSKRKGLFFKS